MIEGDLTRIINEVNCPPYELDHGPLMGSGHWFVQARVWHQNQETGEWEHGLGRQVIVSPGMSPDIIINQCFKAFADLGMDEIRAAFTWRGKRVMSGKVPLEAVWRALR